MRQLWTYLRENQNQVFIALGQTTLIFLFLLAIYYSILWLAQIPGFNFDPFLFGLIVLISWQLHKLLVTQNQLLENQNQLLQHWLKQPTRTNLKPIKSKLSQQK